MSLGYRWSMPYISLESALVRAVQHALKGYGIKHPDSKRTRRAKLESRARKQTAQ